MTVIYVRCAVALSRRIFCFFGIKVHRHGDMRYRGCAKRKSFGNGRKSLDNGGQMLYNNILYHNVFLCLFHLS